MIDYKKQGKKNRNKGVNFETKIRKDLEKSGWIVAKWSNNVEFEQVECLGENNGFVKGKLIPAKHKFNPFKKVFAMGTGFPDFIAFKLAPLMIKVTDEVSPTLLQEFLEKFKEAQKKNQDVVYGGDAIITGGNYEVIGVECKSNGYLDKIEKEKCKWLLENKIFGRILIDKKGKKRGEIIYEEIENGRI